MCIRDRSHPTQAMVWRWSARSSWEGVLAYRRHGKRTGQCWRRRCQWRWQADRWHGPPAVMQHHRWRTVDCFSACSSVRHGACCAFHVTVHWAHCTHCLARPPIRSEYWVNCEESIYSRPIACCLACSLALYLSRTSRLAARILPNPTFQRCWICSLFCIHSLVLYTIHCFCSFV